MVWDESCGSIGEVLGGEQREEVRDTFRKALRKEVHGNLAATAARAPDRDFHACCQAGTKGRAIVSPHPRADCRW